MNRGRGGGPAKLHCRKILYSCMCSGPCFTVGRALTVGRRKLHCNDGIPSLSVLEILEPFVSLSLDLPGRRHRAGGATVEGLDGLARG